MKKHLRIISTLLIILMMTFAFVSCGDKAETPKEEVKTEVGKTEAEPKEEATEEKTEEKTEEATEEAKPFLEIENYDGEMLVIEKKPMSIASMVLGTDEILLEMVDAERIVGLSGQVGNGETISLVAENADKYPKIEKNFETLISLKPDLVIGSSWINKELLQQIKDAGIPYYGYKSPNTIAEQMVVLEKFAKVLGEEEKGKALVGDITKRVDAIKEKAKEIKAEEMVTVLPYNMHGKTNAKGTIVDEIIYMIGAKNAGTEAGLEKRAKIAKEKIIEIDPDYILMLAWGKDDLAEFDKFVEDMKNDPSLKDLKAIKNDHVIIEKGRYFTIVTQNLIDGIEFLSKAVYPEVYGK